MRRMMAISMIALAAIACSKETAKQTVRTTKQRVRDAFDVEAPYTPKTEATDTAAREKARFDEQWQQLQSFRAQQAAEQQAALQQQQAAEQQAALQQQQAAEQQALANVQFVPRGKKSSESFKGLDANGINAAPVMLPITGDVAGPSVLKAQVYLDRNHFSVATIDGRWGRNSAISVWWWQRAHGLEGTGAVDEATFRSLAAAAGAAPAVVQHQLTADDVKGPFVHLPDDVYEKAKLDCLCYETLREKLAERFHSSEDFLERLNPDVKINDLQEGATINVPNVRDPVPPGTHDIAKIVISIAGNTFNGYDAAEQLVFHAPTTLGSTYDPSPDETLKIVKIIENPHFHYDPTLYHEVPDTDPDAHLNPGPNSPVGVVWMALSKPHYGIHGTNDPESIGYASSHGCVRLTNWDAAEVAHRISEGTPVVFVDTRKKE